MTETKIQWTNFSANCEIAVNRLRQGILFAQASEGGRGR